MAAVGYGLYCKMIEETIARLRGEVEEKAVDPVLDVKVDAYLPDHYVASSSDRLELYRRIASVRTSQEREDVTDELIDRFGEPPAQVMRLMDVAQLRSQCMSAGIDSIRQDGYTCFVRFIPAAPIDGMKLFTLLGTWEGRLTLTVKEPPTLRLILPREEQVSALDTLLRLTEQLIACKREEN
jgi:transcription-repair coupling factor (superfamily II helicase)